MKPDTFLIKIQEINFMTLDWWWETIEMWWWWWWWWRETIEMWWWWLRRETIEMLVLVVVEGKMHKKNEEVE